MKKLFSLCIFVMLFSFGFAQKAVIEFSERNYDFGKIEEADGPVSVNFEFKNTGVAPLVVNGVSASCGCTTPDWTREPVVAGAKGFVKVTYSVVGRPGPFKKSITVRSNASEEVVVLTLGGEVIPRPKSVEEELPIKIGGVRLKSNSTPLFDIYKDDSRTDIIKLRNISDKEVKLAVADVPKHIVFELKPAVLKPNQDGTIVITYNSKNINDYGSRTDFAYLVLDGKEVLTDDYKIYIASNITEDFRKLTQEQRSNAPVVVFESKSIEFQAKKGEKKSSSIVLKNTGKENLVVRKLKLEKGISRVSCSKSTIAPGKTAVLKVDIDTNKMSGDTYSKVVVITNDPNNPSNVISVNTKIIK